jgi:hypothetical protein
MTPRGSPFAHTGVGPMAAHLLLIGTYAIGRRPRTCAGLVCTAGELLDNSLRASASQVRRCLDGTIDANVLPVVVQGADTPRDDHAGVPLARVRAEDRGRGYGLLVPDGADGVQEREELCVDCQCVSAECVLGASEDGCEEFTGVSVGIASSCCELESVGPSVFGVGSPGEVAAPFEALDVARHSRGRCCHPCCHPVSCCVKYT